MADKITKRMVLESVKAYAEANPEVAFGEVTAEDVINYAQTTIEQMEKKAETAKANRAKKQAAPDELANAVLAVLNDNPQTIREIAEQIDFDGEVTDAKISARLTKLVKAGYAEKEPVKVEKRRLMAYKVM